MKIAQQYFNRGNSKIFLQDYAGAIVYFDKGIEINPKFAKAYYKRGLAKSYYQESKRLTAQSTRFSKISVKDTRFYDKSVLSMVYSIKNSSEAIADFDKAIEINPGFAKAYYSRGLAKNYYHNHAGVIHNFDRSAEIDIEFAEAYEKDGIVMGYNQKDYDGVISDFDKAIEIDPGFAEAYYSRGLAKNHRQSQLEIVNLGKKHNDNELSSIDENIELFINDYLKDCLGAIADFDKAIEIDPGYAEAYYCRGLAKNDYLDYRSAMRNLNKRLSDESETIGRDYSKDIAMYYQLKDYSGAIADFDMAIKINPKHAKAYYNRGLVKNYFQDHLDEIDNFSRTNERGSEFTESNCSTDLRMNFGYRNYSGAIADFDKAIEINPRYAKAYYRRGIVKNYYQDHYGALMDFNKVIEVNPAYAEAYYRRGKLKEILDQKENGLLDLRRAEELGYTGMKQVSKNNH